MTVTIRTYPNKLDKTQFSIDTFPAGQSLTAILSEAVPSFRVMKTPPIWVRRNGREWLPSQWETPLVSGDYLDIDVQPKGWEVLVAGLIAAIVGAAVAMSMVPSDNYNRTSPDGSPIYDTNAQGNQIRLMGIIPEVFGTHATYPSLINMAHRYYFNDDEYLLLFTMVGIGFYQLTDDKILVGNTPISYYSGDIDTAIFDPGEDVSSHPAHLNTYTSPEVGSTSGTSGIELEGVIKSIQPPKTQFLGNQISIYQDLDGILVPYWPPEWEAGMVLEVKDSDGKLSVSESHSSGGWRSGESGRLTFWGRNIELSKRKLGEYLRYPVKYTPSWDSPPEIEYATGVVDRVETTQVNGEDFYVVHLLDDEGYWVPYSSLPSGAESVALELFGRDDGFYVIDTPTGKNATMKKQLPAQTGYVIGWSSFSTNGVAYNVRITAQDSLPGKPIGPYFACPENETTNEISVDLKYAEGLGYMEDDGAISSRQVRVRIEWRAEGETEWQGMEWNRSGATKDQLGNTIPIKLGRHIRPQVRLYRITGKSNDSRTWDTVELVRLKSVLQTPTQYHDGTTLAFRIRGTNALSRTAENKLMCIPTRMLHVPDGQGGWTGSDYTNKTGMQPTDDIVPVARYVTHAVGHSDDQFPESAWLPLHEKLAARQDHFAAQFDNPDTFWEAMKRILAPGFSVPTMEYGELVPVRDEPRTSWDHIYTPDNMTGEGLDMQVRFEDMDSKDGVEVEYFSFETWKPETVLCLLPGDLGLNPKKVKAFGITSYQKAWVFGMRERRMMKYVDTEYSWGTEMDGFNSSYLSYVALSDDVPGYGQTGKLLDIVPVPGGYVLQLDDELEWQDGEPHYLALRKPDGRLSGPYLATKASNYPDEVKIKVASELDFTPDFSGNMEPPFWMFGTAERWCFPALVSDIKPSGTDEVSMKARNYTLSLYLDDDAIAPIKGNDPVLGMTLVASGNAAVLSSSTSLAYFRSDDEIRLSLDEQVYRVTEATENTLTLQSLDGIPAVLSFPSQSITLTLTHRL